MNEEFNPYAQQPSADNPYAYPQNTEPMNQQYPQQPQYPQYPQPQQYQQYQPYQPYQQPPQNQIQQQPYPYQQQYYYTQQPQGNKAAGMAKAFSIVSFVSGCISLFVSVLFMIFVLFALSLSNGYHSNYSAVFQAFASLSAGYSMILAIPGGIFGILALVKKTRMKPFAILGLIFNGSLLLVALFSLIGML